MINYKSEYIWQSYEEGNCTSNSVSSYSDNMNLIFVRDLQGLKFESSNPETASLNLSYNDIDCGGGYFVKSSSVPYIMDNIQASDFRSDNGRIHLGDFYVKFSLDNSNRTCNIQGGEFIITTFFKI